MIEDWVQHGTEVRLKREDKPRNGKRNQIKRVVPECCSPSGAPTKMTQKNQQEIKVALKADNDMAMTLKANAGMKMTLKAEQDNEIREALCGPMLWEKECNNEIA